MGDQVHYSKSCPGSRKNNVVSVIIMIIIIIINLIIITARTSRLSGDV